MAEDKKKFDLKLTLSTFLKNPSGSNSAYLASRKLIIASLRDAFNKLIKKHKTFVYYTFDTGKELIYHIKIPSEREEAKRVIYYDVIFEIEYDKNSIPTYFDNNSLRVFSNSPSFGFTYGYVVAKNDLLPKWLDKKVSKEMKNKKPTKRNPVESLGFEKSLYFAALFIKEKKLNLYSNAKKNIKLKPNKKLISSGIRSIEDKTKEYHLTKITKKEKDKRDKKDSQMPTKKTTKTKKVKRVTGTKKITKVSKVNGR